MGLMEWYGRHYKALFLIPIVLLIISAVLIGFTVAETGTFVAKGVTLSGGVSATVSIDESVEPSQIQSAIEQRFPQADVEVRRLNAIGASQSYIVDAAAIASDEQESAELLEAFLEDAYAVSALTTETTGPSLGDAFFNQTIVGILLAFLWMGWVVYLYFGDRLSLKIGVVVLVLILTGLAVQGALQSPIGMLILALSLPRV